MPLNETLEEKGRHFSSFGDNLRLFEVILGPLCSLSLDDCTTTYQDASPARGDLQGPNSPPALLYRPRAFMTWGGLDLVAKLLGAQGGIKRLAPTWRLQVKCM